MQLFRTPPFFRGLCLLFFSLGFLQVQAQSEPNPEALDQSPAFEKVTFSSLDGLTVVGNLYEVEGDLPVILLCHQAGFNKYEYSDIAPRLNEMGFNCLAIDQRSGGDLGDSQNETRENAVEKGIKALSYMDAEQDIEAAINYLFDRYQSPVVLWGSSYSSSLALFLGQTKLPIQAILSFSPGDYFGDSMTRLKDVVPTLKQPFFITSSQKEAAGIEEMLKEVKISSTKVHFVPQSEGFHGSKALWIDQVGADEYWDAVKDFLRNVAP